MSEEQAVEGGQESGVERPRKGSCSANSRRFILTMLIVVFLAGWALLWLFVVARGGAEYLLQPHIPFYSLGRAYEGLLKGRPDDFFVIPLILFWAAVIVSALACFYRRGTTVAVMLILLFWMMSCLPFGLD